MLAHSVEKRFVAIILAVLVLLVAPLFLLFFHLTDERYRQAALDRGQIMLEANAKALGKPLWDLDVESVRQITHAIAVGRSVTSVRVRDAAGMIDFRMPETATEARDKDSTRLSAEIAYETVDGRRKVGVIEMDISPSSMFVDNRRNDFVFIAIFVLAVLAIVLAAIVGNRHFAEYRRRLASASRGYRRPR